MTWGQHHFALGHRLLPALALLALGGATPALADCRLCAKGDAETRRAADDTAPPLRIEVETALDFSRLAVAAPGGGAIEVDPATGQRRLSGALIDLGGMALTGSVRVSGEPGRAVRIRMPDRVMLTAPDGGAVELRDIVADLAPMPRLGADGTLRFQFGGRLAVDGQVSGAFRGRIPIVADYE